MGRRFLIGGGSNCQLQLGGGDVPILHSILLVEEDGAHIDAVVSTPELLVNGRPQRSADLHDGDVFSIGKFEFQVHVPQPTGALQAAAGQAPAVPQTADELGQLSAAELVTLIEAEQRQVAEFENGCNMGAAALLDAVRRVAGTRGGEASRANGGTGLEFLLSFPPASSSADDAPVIDPTVESPPPMTTRRAS